MDKNKPMGFFEGLMIIARLLGGLHRQVDGCLKKQEKAGMFMLFRDKDDD